MRFCEVCGAAFRSFSTCPRDRVPTRVNVEDPLIGSILGDRYRILDRIAAGGMGQVYRAAHTRIACLFAVKVLYGDLAFDQQMMSRFLREAEVASCLQSRHIVRVVDFGQSQAGLPYLAMEYLDGPTLFDMIARGGPLAPARALRIAQRILRGLSHAHERGIVHRDMKTENVILTAEDDEEDIPKILDFGVARLRESGDSRLTTAGVILGTPLYMAPEQLMGAEVDARTDLYAVGVILFEMLRGSPPFEAPSIRELAEKHISAPPPDLTQAIVEAGGDAATNDIVQKLLAKDPAKRYASARDAASAMEAILSKPSQKSAPPTKDVAPPTSPELVSLLENAILAGAPAYNAGDHLGCAGLYRRTAEEALKRFPTPVACAARLRAGILRSSARSVPMLAAWELRYAFDDLLLAAPIPVRGSKGDGAGEPTAPIAHELAAFASISARRETAGHMGILGDYAVEFARALAGLMRSDPAFAASAQTLDEAVRAAEGADPGGPRVTAMQQGLDRVRAAVEGRATTVSSARDALRDAPPSFGPPPAIRSLPPPPSAEPSPAAERAGGDDVSESLIRAMLIAKAAFDEARFDVACRVYRESLEDVARIAARDPKGAAYSTWIRTALESASRRPEKEASLVLRHAAEALLKRQ